MQTEEWVALRDYLCVMGNLASTDMKKAIKTATGWEAPKEKVSKAIQKMEAMPICCLNSEAAFKTAVAFMLEDIGIAPTTLADSGERIYKEMIREADKDLTSLGNWKL